MTATAPPIVFLDRDGTIMVDSGYVRDPADVILLPGAAEAIARLNAAGIPVAVVTNQSGIARGILTEAEYQAVAARLDALLAEAGAHIDATAVCPHAPEVSGPCDCRKPAVGGHRQLAMDLGCTVRGSWCIGDRLSDLEPAAALGGKAILVRTGEGRHHLEAASRAGHGIHDDLASAVASFLGPATPERL
ncbi:MAG: HAD-IIIA family hydrolase [Gemmatimonadales bacterium]|nr:HAD-IIIA family hydrolase [Gemmatimonadales bacterium]